MSGRRLLVKRSKSLCLICVVIITCLFNLIFLTHFIDNITTRVPDASLSSYDRILNEIILNDGHPISNLMKDADRRWQNYEDGRSRNFREAVRKYRQAHGRHPPPGFKEWYKFARQKNAHNVDDFQQIIDDLQPFWAIPPKEIRQMALQLQDSEDIAGVRVRGGKVVSRSQGWRVETLSASIERLARYLPDMDIAMNTLDQPRIMVPYEVIQSYLRVAQNTKNLSPAVDRFTKGMDHFYNERIDNPEPLDLEWQYITGKPYMDFVKKSCSPKSPANAQMSPEDADVLYKEPLGGFISNFTASSDLCTVGPVLGDKHGFLFSASSNVITRKLLPVFSECKVSVNNDILFPANMYFRKDPRYLYNAKHDKEWDQKDDILLWRGATSGGVQIEDNWHRLHRQRFVRMANATEMENQTVPILVKDTNGLYRSFSDYHPSDFAASYFDVGFTEAWGCIPDCSFYEGIWTYKEQQDFSEQFKSKYLADIDGHTFSGRWRAFHQSKSLGLKATIFREWHDSRLFAWRHFIPMDNQFTDLYPLMTYFIGLDLSASGEVRSQKDMPSVPRHDLEAQRIATQSHEWAQIVLRDEDLDIYLYLLLLEYGRIIDDNREHIGYSGDGSELDDFDAKQG